MTTDFNFEQLSELAAKLDDKDLLKNFRSEFAEPRARHGDLQPVYFCGNSLGLMPYRAKARLQESLNDWQRYAVDGHFSGDHPWLSFHHEARQPLADIVGARHNEVVAMNALTVNLHLLLATFFQPAGKRRKILIEAEAFPSDRFAIESQLRWHGLDPADDLLLWESSDNQLLDMNALEAQLEKESGNIALLLLPGVQYYTGQQLDIPKLSELAKRHGAVLGLDLAHSVGNTQLSLHDDQVDFACWCSYKYLNGGPGAVGGAFVHQRHLDNQQLPRLLGWWGNDESTRFQMARNYQPADGADKWQLSNAAVFSLAPVLGSLEVFADAKMPTLVKKSQALGQFLYQQLDRHFNQDVSILTPADPQQRGCQLSLKIKRDKVAARQVFKTLESLNVIGDWREPNAIRVAPAPLYNSYTDVALFLQRLRSALNEPG